MVCCRRLASVVTELGLRPETVASPPGEATVFSFRTLNELHDVLDRTYRLALSLPDAPLKEFLDKTKSAPRTTEAERLVIQRVGQDIFRQALMKYWNGRCPLTGITDPALLRASHIVPWSECESDAQRLDVHNGLLLSALWDAAFDAAEPGRDWYIEAHQFRIEARAALRAGRRLKGCTGMASIGCW